MEWSDAELAAGCLEGRKDLFETLVVRHQDAVFNLAYRMTGRRAEAADIAQEAFIRAYRSLRTYSPDRSFRNWVMGICANLAKNSFRREARRRAVEERHAIETGPGADATPPAADDPRREALDATLMELPETMRTPLVLKYVEGLSGEEIARALGIGLSAVKMRLARGREELAGRLRARLGGATI